ncbi:MAG TPA: tetratricopeptide repeat protein [bacterium]
MLRAAALVAAVVIAYSPAFTAGFIWDDDDYITDNRTLTEPGGLTEIWLSPGATPQYYPLVFTSFLVEQRLFGRTPAGHHAVNVLLHAGSALLLWRLLTTVAVPGAWLAAALFALHPVQVESVAWIAERKNVLSGLFFLAGALTFLQWAGLRAGDGDRSGSTRGAPGRLATAAVLFAAALFSKTVTATLPVSLGAVLWWKRGRLSRRELLALAAFAAAGAGMGMVTLRLERTVVGAVGPAWDLTFVERLLVAGRAFWFYLGKLAWPSELAFIYPRWDPQAASWGWGLWPAAAAAFVLGLWALRRRIGRGPLVACLHFAGSLGPAFGFVNVFPMQFSFVADHFQYLATIGPLTLAASLIWRLVAPAGTPGRRPWLLAAAFALPVAMGLLTHQQSRFYQDSATLWGHTVTLNPGSWMVHSNLSRALAARDDRAGAESELREALRLEPSVPSAWFRLGELAAAGGRLGEAVELFQRALDLVPMYADAHDGLGDSLTRLGRDADAEEHLLAAGWLKPRDPKPRLHLGYLYLSQGRVSEATKALTDAVELEPGSPEARLGLGRSLAAQGLRREALEQFRHALSLRPGWAEAEAALAGG